jgi:murein DD-endopeptidase MepM/ murein hydrolase activator NlpD
VSLKVGDKVKGGDVIGKIDEPTNYYCVEGSNLFFEVLKDDQSVNPMLFLH